MDASMTCARAAFVVAAVAALAGCGGGPSEAEVRLAMVKQAEASGARMIAPNYQEEIEKAKVIGCAKADAGGYACDVSNAAGRVANLRFVKADQGWAIVN